MKTPEKKSGRGGRRAGAGRPSGSRDRVSIQGLIQALDQRTGGQSYEELLVEDFIQARVNQDGNLTQKYHHLLSNKLLADRLDIEVNEDADTVTAKRAAFAAALAAVAGLNKQDK
jgi:hypothetical protein